MRVNCKSPEWIKMKFRECPLLDDAKAWNPSENQCLLLTIFKCTNIFHKEKSIEFGFCPRTSFLFHAHLVSRNPIQTGRAAGRKIVNAPGARRTQLESRLLR